MKKLLLLSLFFFSFHALFSQNLLSGKYSYEQLRGLLVPQAKWTPFPRMEDRAGWAKADPRAGDAVIKKAAAYLGYEWPAIPATKSLLIVRNGDRASYETISFKKREVLGTLLLAEIYENKGRFTDDIINGVWSVCEESFWGASAHLPRNYDGLMDVSAPFVELFSAETAMLLSWVDYFMGDKLDAVSPQIRKRIYYETNNRIFRPLMTKYHGWMSTTPDGRRPNNWNPWICSNWLNSVLLLEKNDSLRTATVQKILGVLDAFLNPYPADGGCDEGPGYWGAAAASLYDNIAMLNLASGNAFRYVYQDEKVRNMGRFIYRAQISEHYFLDFADADPQPGMPATMIYRFGKDIEDTAMMKFGAFYLKEDNKVSAGGFHYFRNLFAVFMEDEFEHVPKGLQLPENVWWPDLQVMVARDHGGSTDGFFVAAKGGNNDESHNHNDIGNFVVYYDGLPVLIDVGRGTYTAKTFSAHRYDIWFNQSDYHNDPNVNGQAQSPGPLFKAKDVAYKTAKGFSQLTMDIGPSYRAAAGIRQWQRGIRLNRGKDVAISETIRLERADSLTEHFMTCYPATLNEPGIVVIHGKQDFYLRYPAGKFGASIEKVSLTGMEDKGVQQKWGDNIYRINLKALKPEVNTQYNFSLTK